MNDMKRHLKVDNELAIVFLLVVIIGMIYFFVVNQKAFLNFFYIPVLLGAYFYGKRYGAYSAFFSVIMVFAMAYFIPETFKEKSNIEMSISKWLDITTWGCFLIIVGYLMGALYEKKEKYNREIKKTYQGIITMLSLILDSVDQYTQNHSIRVAKYSEKIAKEAGLPKSEIEDIKIASLLHDLGKIGVSAEILHKIGELSDEEKKEITGHTGNAKDILEPVGGRVLRILPLIINHHERYDGNGYNGLLGDSVPMGAKIIAVADVYDALTADRPYRKALSPLEVKEEIVKGAGTHFDPEVVKYFENVFPTLEIEEPVLT